VACARTNLVQAIEVDDHVRSATARQQVRELRKLLGLLEPGRGHAEDPNGSGNRGVLGELLGDNVEGTPLYSGEDRSY
jgi:hypothetical protein